jgi:Arc/MetJ-type ribon-helix-helix transcriptional regulator
MATNATVSLNLRIPREQYEELEELVRVRHYTSKGEFIRDLLRRYMDEYTDHLHEKADRDKNLHVPLREYGESRGLE